MTVFRRQLFDIIRAHILIRKEEREKERESRQQGIGMRDHTGKRGTDQSKLGLMAVFWWQLPHIIRVRVRRIRDNQIKPEVKHALIRSNKER
jgi:hypothetical protein